MASAASPADETEVVAADDSWFISNTIDSMLTNWLFEVVEVRLDIFYRLDRHMIWHMLVFESSLISGATSISVGRLSQTRCLCPGNARISSNPKFTSQGSN